MGRPAVKIGVIGCGNISAVYLPQAQKYSVLDVVACADLEMDRARARAAEYGVPHAYTVEELLADPQIEVVLNLTVPAAHADVARAAIAAGKHIYNEKPLALSREDGQALLRQAHARHLRVGCAPDTFLGAGLATCRKLIDDGWIGEPVAATAFMTGHGPESWHPDPSFLYQPGAGPLFDMGPYYLTALTVLIGPVTRVTGSARISFPERTITSAPQYGTLIRVNTPTHVAGILTAFCTADVYGVGSASAPTDDASKPLERDMARSDSATAIECGKTALGVEFGSTRIKVAHLAEPPWSTMEPR